MKSSCFLPLNDSANFLKDLFCSQHTKNKGQCQNKTELLFHGCFSFHTNLEVILPDEGGIGIVVIQGRVGLRPGAGVLNGH